MNKQDPLKPIDPNGEIIHDEALKAEGVYHAMKIDMMAPLAVPLAAPPSSSRMRRTAIAMGQWEAPPLACCVDAVPNGLMTWLFPCAPAAQIAHRIGEPFWLWYAVVAVLVMGFEAVTVAEWSTSHIVTSASFNTTIAGRSYYTYDDAYVPDAVGYVSLGFATALFAVLWRLRTLVRRKFELPGTMLEDALRSAFSPCCSLAQMATHTKSYKRGACNFGRPDELPAYDFDA